MGRGPRTLQGAQGGGIDVTVRCDAAGTARSAMADIVGQLSRAITETLVAALVDPGPGSP